MKNPAFDIYIGYYKKWKKIAKKKTMRNENLTFDDEKRNFFFWLRVVISVPAENFHELNEKKVPAKKNSN